MDNKTKKILAGFMTASLMVASTLTLSGCSPRTDLDRDDENAPGVVTSSWNNNTQQWDHYRTWRGSDYYFGSSAYPHSTTVVNPAMPGIAKSAGPVSVQSMSSDGFSNGVSSSISSGAAKGGIGGGGGRASAAS